MQCWLERCPVTTILNYLALSRTKNNLLLSPASSTRWLPTSARKIRSLRTIFATTSPERLRASLCPRELRLYVELAATEIQAKEGKADLSKIQLESVIVWVVKQRFPPPAANQK